MTSLDWPASRSRKNSPMRSREALDAMGVALVDHIIVADNDYVSLRESGSGKELLELLAQLGGQDLVVGQHQGGALHGLNDLGHGVGLSRPGASVSCIYGLGEPDDFEKMMVSLRVGDDMGRDELLRRLVDIRYEISRS